MVFFYYNIEGKFYAANDTLHVRGQSLIFDTTSIVTISLD